MRIPRFPKIIYKFRRRWGFLTCSERIEIAVTAERNQNMQVCEEVWERNRIGADGRFPMSPGWDSACLEIKRGIWNRRRQV